MITIMIPAYNEQKNIKKAVLNVIKAAKEAGGVKLDIVVVDDASTDNTPKIIKKLSKAYPFVRSIRHKTTMGIGAGLKDVIKIAKYPKFMIVPGDNDCALKLLTKLYKNRNKAEMVLSFYLNKEMRGRFRNFISTLYGLVYMTTFNVYIQYFNGVGIYPTEKIKKINLKANGFSITAELNTKLLSLGCTLYELPGYMQTGQEGSKSIKLKNFIEVALTYFCLIYELKFAKKYLFNKKPVRILE